MSASEETVHRMNVHLPEPAHPKTKQPNARYKLSKFRKTDLRNIKIERYYEARPRPFHGKFNEEEFVLAYIRQSCTTHTVYLLS